MYFTGGIHKVYILQQKSEVCVFHWMEEHTTSPFAASPCLAKREPRDLQNYCSEQGACQPVSFEQREEALTSLCNSILENAVVSMQSICQLGMRHARLAVTPGPWTERAPSSLLHTIPNVRCLLRLVLSMKRRQRSDNNIFHL